MPSLDFSMPIALLIVVTVALLLSKRVEGKLIVPGEEKELKIRDILLLIVFMAIIISVIAYSSMIGPGAIFENILLVVFLASYTMLLFNFTYAFSNLTKIRVQLLSLGFGVGSLIAGLASLLGPLVDGLTVYRAIAFFALAAFCFGVILFEQKKISSKVRWYVAAQPAALFVLLFVFFNVIYQGGTQIWFPLLMDAFGLTFAILIILYLSSLFSWKTVGIFAILLTIMDIILVFSGPMVEAAGTFTSLGLPVLVYLPKVPLTLVPPEYIGLSFLGFIPSGLGLGDFFFAGVLAIQTLKKFDKKTALISVIAMVIAFGIWEAFLPEIVMALKPILGKTLAGFPGTLMIISGWVPIIAWKLLSKRKGTQELIENELTK